MSRTDIHRPAHARLLDKGAASARHDHRLGECDLPDLDDFVHGRVEGRTRCEWWFATGVEYESHGCGCDMCTGQSWRKRERRRQRHNKRREIEEALLEYQSDLSNTGVWVDHED